MTKTLASATTKTSLDGGHHFAALGLIIALLAFFLSAATPWVMAEFQPPPPADQEAEFSFSRWLYDELYGTEELSEDPASEDVQQETPIAREDHWTHYWSLIVIAVAMAGLINSTIGILQRQSKIITITGVTFGVMAIVFQYFIIAVSILVVLVLLVFLLSAIGVDF